MMKRSLATVAFVIFCLITGGCSLETAGSSGSGNRSFIDAPLTETEWIVGFPIAISTHANFGVTRILVQIMKEPYYPAEIETLESTLEEITPGVYQSNMYWTPREAGRYRLTAYSYTGSRINDWGTWTTHTIYINVADVLEDESIEEPHPTPMPTAAPAAEEATAPRVNFQADQLNLAAGACTTLRWEAQDVEELLMDGEAVAFNGSRQVCPSTSKTYYLIGTSAGGRAEESLTVTVLTITDTPAPIDTSGPTLSNLSQSATKIFDNSACGPDKNTISIKVQDSSGISKVELNYRAKDVKATGGWKVISMTASSGGIYKATLGKNELDASLSIDALRIVDVYIQAWDSSNNMSQSTQISFEMDICIF